MAAAGSTAARRAFGRFAALDLARSKPYVGVGHTLAERRFSVVARYRRKAEALALRPDACQDECLERLDALRTALLSGRRATRAAADTPRGLYMYGGVGTGKTMMLDLFHEELLDAGINCQRQHFHEFLQAVHSRLHRLRCRVGAQRGLLALAAEEYRAEFPVLAFDEAHVLNVGDALMLRTFFEAYFRAGGVMVATSNVAPDDLYASGINREVFLPFLDALRDRCDFFEMRGRHDYRSIATEAGRLRGAYLARNREVDAATLSAASSGGGASPLRHFPELHKALALPDDAAYLPAAVDIDVGFGRTLHCRAAWHIRADASTEAQVSASEKRVVAFSFDELCRSATGPSEWVGLADYADAIIVTGVPQFAAHDEDAARRFVTFVDIVYDKQRFLVLTADAGPEHLFAEFVKKYSGGDFDTVAPSSQRKPSAKAESKMKMPEHGLGSGRHGVVFQKPKQLQYGEHGSYVTLAQEGIEAAQQPVPHATSSTRTGGRAEHGLGDPNRVMQGVVEEDSDWVEWSATGLKDASLFDLSPVQTDAQVTDKLLPFRRCASRLVQMQPR